TGFFIPTAQPPAGETDGPLGALFLARALIPLGIRVILVTDAFCERALQAGLSACGLIQVVPLLTLPPAKNPWLVLLRFDTKAPNPNVLGLTHLLALERVGPSHTAASLRAQPGSTSAAVEQFVREVPSEHHDRCHTMRGRDITADMNPAHILFGTDASEA